MNHEAAAQQPARTTASGLTCNINGIPPQQRARYGRLVEALRRAIEERRELQDGYAFQMDTAQIDTGQLVEWIELETAVLPVLRVRGPLGLAERPGMAPSDRARRSQGLRPGRVWVEVECPKPMKSRLRDRESVPAEQIELLED